MKMQSLVEYSSSSDEDMCESERKSKEPSKKRKLPVPDWFKSKSSKTEPTYDDSDLHQGRQRSVKHERGIWATFLYIPVPAKDLIEEIQDAIKSFCEANLNLRLEEMQDFHISVTKLLILRHHWIQAFIESVTTKIKGISKFKTNFSEIEIYCNEEKTRTFVGIKTLDVENLMKITNILDECLEEFKLPKYYEDPSFHTSILWCLGDKSNELKGKLHEIQEIFNRVINENEVEPLMVDEVMCKCGNRLYKFPLS